MKRHTFVCAKHEEYGTMGWKLKNMAHFDPLGGMTIAHDILEHFPNDDGIASGECQALGASLYVRGEEYSVGIKNSSNSPGTNMSGDIVNLFSEGREIAQAPKTKPLDDDAENWIQDCMHDARKKAAYRDVDDVNKLEEFFQNAIGWLRIGYKRAKVRYAGLTTNELAYFFYEIEKQADKYLKMAEEGQELVVSTDTKNLRVEVFMKETWE